MCDQCIEYHLDELSEEEQEQEQDEIEEMKYDLEMMSLLLRMTRARPFSDTCVQTCMDHNTKGNVA